MTCIKCGKDHSGYRFRTLRVETLHIRDMTEKRVQALGDFEEFALCEGCAREKYDEYINNGEVMKKTGLPFLLMVPAGIAVALLFRSELPILMFGVGLIVCGLACFYGNFQRRTAKKRELESLSPEKALYRCAWECVLESAPRKNGDNDITYIPVDEETMARKNGDLMILYDLLPAIAMEAHKRIHAED